MNLHFDERGYLVANDLRELSWAECQHIFVQKMTDSITRKKLWFNFSGFINRFQDEITDSFEIWLDGSFYQSKTSSKRY
jgi:hypothetical protein